MATSIEKIPRLVHELPEGVEAEFKGNVLTLQGPLGRCSRDFSKVLTDVSLEDRRILITPSGTKRTHRAVANTALSLVKGMATGVTKGFTYRLKVVFAHFPVTVKVKGKEVHVENFYGERSPRVARIVGDCKVSVEGEDVVVKGVSAEDTGQTAANIEQATRIRRKDPRVFLDGVYVYEKRRGDGQHE